MRNQFFLGVFMMILSFCTGLSGQHLELAVPLNGYGQKASRLCWAASMDMIMDYQLPANTLTQCFLAEEYVRLAYGYATSCSSICTDACPGTAPSDCNSTVPYSHFTPYTYYEKSYFDFIFTEQGFYSMQDQVILSWDQYTNEIDHCRPVMLQYYLMNVDSTVSLEKDFSHTVVGKGYTTLTGHTSGVAENYFIINDPWEVCQGEFYLLHEDVLTGTSQVPVTVPGQPPSFIDINYLGAMVHHISPKEESCDPCQNIPERDRFIPEGENPLLKLIREHHAQFFPTVMGSKIPKEGLEDLFEKGHFSTQIHYFSYDAFRSLPFTNLSFKSVVANADVRELTYFRSQRPLMTRLRCSLEGDYCAVEKIGFGRRDQSQIVVAGSDTIQLSNDPTDAVQVGDQLYDYSIVRFFPYTFEFYRFQYQGQVYYYPVEAYAKAYFYGEDLKASRVAIPEREVLRGLDDYVNKYDEEKSLEKNRKCRLKRYLRFLQRDGFLKMQKYLRRNKF